MRWPKIEAPAPGEGRRQDEDSGQRSLGAEHTTAPRVPEARRPQPVDCPRFDRCSAPVCPLDPDWRRRRHKGEDRVCLYLSEMAKAGGSAANLGGISREMAAALDGCYPEIIASLATVRNRLRKAAKTGPRLGVRPQGRQGRRHAA